MSATTTCPSCGEPLAPDAPESLCPRCLLQGAVDAEPDPERTLDASEPLTAPGPGTPTKHRCSDPLGDPHATLRKTLILQDRNG